MAKRRRSHSPLSALMRWLLVLAALALFVYWGNTDIKTDAVTYTSPALPAAFDGLRIVQLSDLHNREFGQDNAELYKAVENAAPDVIFLTGDLVDEYAAEPVPYARAWVRPSAPLPPPTMSPATTNGPTATPWWRRSRRLCGKRASPY